MRKLALLLGLAFLSGLLLPGGCGSDSAPALPEQAASTPEGDAQEPGEQEPEPVQQVEENGENGEEPGGDGDQPIPFDRLWPDHPLARKLLIDPEDTSVVFSYWRDSKVGDWVRFLTHEQKIALFTVTNRDGQKVTIEAKHFELNGKEVPKKEPDIRPVDLEKDDQIMRGTLVGIPFLVRTIYEWRLFNSDEVLNCERRTVDNPMGENNETCYAWDVRCGGYVFQRRGNNTYVLLVDYGDAEKAPKWEHLKPSELLKYWYKLNRFLDEKVVSQEDSPEGESPESPEDPPPPEVAKSLKEIEKLAGAGLSKALKEKRFKDAMLSIGRIVELVGEVHDYTRANNYTPAIAEAGKVIAKADELHTACGNSETDKASPALRKLRDLLDIFYISVNYKKEKR